MTADFKSSAWAEKDFSDHYLERADIYVLERRRLLELVRTLYRHLSGGRTGLRVCDLGAGDGIVTEALLDLDGTIRATLVDASSTMLARSRKRLKKYGHLECREVDFGNIAANRAVLPRSDFFVSSMAVHHLALEDKTRFFGTILDNLESGGWFINVDTVLPPTGELENLYFAIWSEWMQEMMDAAGIDDESPSDVIRRYKDPRSSNRPDTVEDQLRGLRKAGFVHVDCFYKNGIFAIYGGRKP